MAARVKDLTAAEQYFLANRGLFPKAIVPLMKERFGLTPQEAIALIRKVDMRANDAGGADASP